MKLKLKYYLRGLGLGIVVTAVIMCIMKSKDNEMTDEEIIARAKQLGLIESTVLIESSPKEDNNVQEDNDVQENDNIQANANVSDSGVQLDAISLLPDSWANTDADKQETQSDTDANEDIEQETQSDTDLTEDIEPDTQSDTDTTGSDTQEIEETTSEFPKVLIISNGEGSYTVSKRLAELGMVESAAEFDTYLCEHGYDKKIRAGTYTIPVGATDEQMAKIVTGAKVTE